MTTFSTVNGDCSLGDSSTLWYMRTAPLLFPLPDWQYFLVCSLVVRPVAWVYVSSRSNRRSQLATATLKNLFGLGLMMNSAKYHFIVFLKAYVIDIEENHFYHHFRIINPFYYEFLFSYWVYFLNSAQPDVRA